MKLVIDIDEELYELYKNFSIVQLGRGNGKTVASNTIIAIKYGIPLPKHHGRLIDADKFQKYCFNKNFDRRLSEGGLATINMFLELQPTIIEAEEVKDVS